MKSKFLFAAAVAALATSCSQEEIAETAMNTVDGRIAIEAPQIVTGKGVSTRMTTEGNVYQVKWEDGDGFGAMLVDEVKSLDAKEFKDRYDITPDNKATNYLFRYDAENSTFNTYAAMVEGNYVFYAPFNENENTRKSLKIKTPLTQTVTPGVYNSAVTEFYGRADHPVFVAYKALEAKNPEKNIKIEMSHIFALPMITLENKYTTTQPVNGKTETVPHNLTVYKVEFVNEGGTFMAEANINNSNVIRALTSKAWGKDKHETASTSDLYVNVGKNTDEITVNFKDGGIKIAPNEKAQFAVVLPAENYEGNLKARVYVKVDDENVEKKFETPIASAKPLRLNPGYPYPAQEYNADGSQKVTKGTSATYTLQGNLINANTPEVKATGIETEEELIAYIKNVAYRGEEIAQVAKASEVTNPGLQFNIKEGATITLTDEFFRTVENSLLVNTTTGTTKGQLKFISNSQLRLGSITNTEDYTLGRRIIYGTDELIVEGNYTVRNGDKITINSGTVTVPEGIKYEISVKGGTVNINGNPTGNSTITNEENGTININGDVYGNLTIKNTGTAKKKATLNIVKGKTVKANIENGVYGTINNAGYLYGTTSGSDENEKKSVTNSGLINVTDANAGINFDYDVEGKICNNIQCEYVKVGENTTVYCDMNNEVKAVVSKINTVNLSGNITFKDNTFSTDLASVKTVNVADNTVITSPSMTFIGVTFNLSGDEKATWKSYHPMVEVIITGLAVNGGSFKLGENVTLTLATSGTTE